MVTRDEFLRQRTVEQKTRLAEYEALWQKYNLLAHFSPDGFERIYCGRLAFTTDELIMQLESKMARR